MGAAGGAGLGPGGPAGGGAAPLGPAGGGLAPGPGGGAATGGPAAFLIRSAALSPALDLADPSSSSSGPVSPPPSSPSSSSSLAKEEDGEVGTGDPRPGRVDLAEREAAPRPRPRPRPLPPSRAAFEEELAYVDICLESIASFFWLCLAACSLFAKYRSRSSGSSVSRYASSSSCFLASASSFSRRRCSKNSRSFSLFEGVGASSSPGRLAGGFEGGGLPGAAGRGPGGAGALGTEPSSPLSLSTVGVGVGA